MTAAAKEVMPNDVPGVRDAENPLSLRNGGNVTPGGAHPSPRAGRRLSLTCRSVRH